MILLAPAALASPSGNPTAACDGTHHSDTGHGANRRGAYDQTCDGSPSGNGNGGGQATGKPCAGCVGNADDKNPKGQASNGSDHNAGYECDRNHGVGRSNPAHTGCAASSSAPPAPTSNLGRGNGRGGGNQGTVDRGVKPTPTPAPPVVDPVAVAPSATTLAVEPSAAADETAVLGVSFLRPALPDHGSVAASVSAAGSELARTGGSAPNLTMVALALVAIGTMLRRMSKPARDRAWS